DPPNRVARQARPLAGAGNTRESAAARRAIESDAEVTALKTLARPPAADCLARIPVWMLRRAQGFPDCRRVRLDAQVLESFGRLTRQVQPAMFPQHNSP